MKFLSIAIALLIATVAIAQQVPSYVPTDNLIGYYPFNASAHDSSGNNNHGNPGGVVNAADRFGNPSSAFYFNGSSWVGLDSISSVSIPQFSYFGWFKRDGITSYDAVILNTRNGRIWLPQGNQDDIYATLYLGRNGAGNSIEFENRDNLIDTNWHSFALNAWSTAWYGPPHFGLDLYIDGIKRTGTYTNPFAADTCENAEIGASGRSNNSRNDFFNGSIDDVGIWERNLTECEILQLHRATKFTISPQPINQHNLNFSDTAMFVAQCNASDAHYQWMYDSPSNGWEEMKPSSVSSGVKNDTLLVWGFPNGTYRFQLRVHIVDTNCAIYSDVAKLTVGPPAGIETANGSEITIFPNPARDYITVQGLLKAMDYTVTDLSGKTVLSGRISPDENKIAVSELIPGGYVVTVGEVRMRIVVAER